MINNLNYHNIKSSDLDDYLKDAGLLIIENNKASIGMLQRVFKIGFNRATHIMDQLCELGVVGEDIGTKPRQVLMDQDAFLDLLSNLPQSDSRYSDTSYSSFEETGKIKNIFSEEELIRTTIGMNPDFSFDGQTVPIVKNTFVCNCTNSLQLDIVDFLAAHNFSKTLKFTIFDENMIYSTYYKLPHLLIPVIKARDKLYGLVDWLIAESRDRFYKFADAGVKNIKAFNLKQKIKEPSTCLPFIIFIVSEFYPLRSDQQLNEKLVQILLNSERTGVYCLFFSTLDAKRLSLGVKEDFFKICSAEQLKDSLLMSIHQSSQVHTSIDIKSVDDMDGVHFEMFCRDILLKNGFTNVETTQSSGDHGIDILAEKDDISYAIQCKCYSSNIGNAAVQQAHTGKSIYQKDIAVVLTNQYFTEQAKSEAAVLGVKLWDRDKLTSLINSAS